MLAAVDALVAAGEVGDEDSQVADDPAPAQRVVAVLVPVLAPANQDQQPQRHVQQAHRLVIVAPNRAAILVAVVDGADLAAVVAADLGAAKRPLS
jgi:hypothetical protein